MTMDDKDGWWQSMLDLLDTTSNMLRGMCMDPAIPKHAKEAMWSRVAQIDRALQEATDADEPGPQSDVAAAYGGLVQKPQG